jgi:hypothetical protein
VDAAVLLDDAAFGSSRVAAALQVAFHHHQLLDHRALTLVIEGQHLAGLALLLAREHEDEIALLDADACAGHG